MFDTASAHGELETDENDISLFFSSLGNKIDGWMEGCGGVVSLRNIIESRYFSGQQLQL